MRLLTAAERGSAERDNEDWFHADSKLIVVLDGATARTDTGCVHGVTWYAHQLGGAIVSGAGKSGISLVDVVSDAIQQVAAMHPDCDLTHPGTPSAGVAILRLAADPAEYFILGDVTVVLETSAGLRVLTDDRVSATAAEERAVADRYLIGSPEKAAALLRMKRAELAARNRPDGYWIAETDPAAVNHALTGVAPRDELRRAAVLTDGAARAVTFGLYDWPGTLHVLDNAGPTELIHQVRAAERRDPVGRRWPRNKTSDDATVVYADLR